MEAELSADKKVEQLSEEELHCVLKQLTDHSVPEREKCPLVQRLNAEEKLLTKNNNSYSSSSSSSASSSSDRNSNHPRPTEKLRSRMHSLRIADNNCQVQTNRFNNSHQSRALTSATSEQRDFVGCSGGGNTAAANHANHAPPVQQQQQHLSCDKAVQNYAQSLPEPRTNNNCDDSQNLRAAISNSASAEKVAGAGASLRSGASNRKPNRANSFTMPSQSDNSSKSDSGALKILDHRLTNGTEVSPEALRGADKQTLDGSLPYRHHKSARSSSAVVVNSAAPSSRSNSSHSPSDTSADHFPCSTKSSTSLNTFSSVHLANISSLVDSINGDTVPKFPRLSDTRSLKSNNNRSLTVQEEDEERLEFGEMKELQSQAQFIEYRRNLNLSSDLNEQRQQHHVDKALEMPVLSAMPGGVSDESTYPNYQGLSNNPSMPLPHTSSSFYNATSLNNNANPTSNNPTNGNRPLKKKKQRKGPKEDVKMSQDFEGFIGYIDDVDILEDWIVSPNATSSNISAVIDKKNKEKFVKQEESEAVAKRHKLRNNGEIKEDKSAMMPSNSNKVSLSSISNSSSLSGDDVTTVVKNSKPNSSPELPNGVPPKKSKAKSTKQDKNNNKVNKNVKNVASACDKEEESSSKLPLGKKSGKGGKANSSTDSTGTDGEDEDEEENLPAVPYRLVKSNSLLPAKTADTPPEEADNPCTVSDSEMADREKGWDTPKQKKKKKTRQGKFPQASVNATSNPNHPKHPGHKGNFNSNALHNLARGYESEREYSLNPYLNANSFVSQSFSSSMHAINSRIFDKRPLHNLSPPTNQDSLQSPPADEILDSDFVELHPLPCDTQDIGPKMRFSYADIAKSVSQPANTPKSSANGATGTTAAAAAVTVTSSSPLSIATTTIFSKAPQVADCTVSAPITAEEFPQLNSPPLDDTTISSSAIADSYARTTTNLPTHSDADSMNVHPNQHEALKREEATQSTPAVSPNTSNNSFNKNEAADSALDSFSTCATSGGSRQGNNSKDDVDSPNETGMPPISFGDSGESSFADEENIFYCDQPTQNFVDGSNKLVFGFFDDSEISMINETDFCPLDPTLYSTQNNAFQINNVVNAADLNGQQIEQNTMDNSTHLEENFYKNAVHVNDLESHYRQLDDRQCEAAQPPSHKAVYSSTASSPLSSSFDSSPASSTVAAALSSSPIPQVQSTMAVDSASPQFKPFINCLSELSNYRFVDNVDRNSYNYSSIIQYVYKSWSQCNVGV